MSLARDYDHFAQEYLVDPYAFWAALRDQEPVSRSDHHGGFWVVSRYADIMEAACDPATFSSRDGTGTPPIPTKLLPIDTDPPLHQKYRKVINPSFTPHNVRAQEGEWRSLAKGLVAALPEDGPVELCSAFAIPFPQQVALRMIGFPDDDRPDLAGWIDDITRLRGIDDEKVGEAAVGVMTRIIERLEERREAPRRDDLMSVLLDAEIDGRPLDDDEQLFSMTLLLLGGLDTTTSAIAMALAHLADHPADRARLLADPDLLDTAVEEFVRVATPVQGLGRTVTRDTTLGGCPLREGDRVFLLWASGNRDPGAFDRPDEVVLDRHPNHHLGFGAGPHRCVGSHAGKLMVKIALQELLPWLGDYSIADELGWVGGETRGLRKLLVQRVNS
ncbi:MAG: cytochrome P450 [Actinobacteria bacterium]|nr:cytochrome P450 [Actinomycetota bacterium]